MRQRLAMPMQKCNSNSFPNAIDAAPKQVFPIRPWMGSRPLISPEKYLYYQFHFDFLWSPERVCLGIENPII